MTVAELIEKLQEFDPTSEVAVRGDGGEWDSVGLVFEGTYEAYRQIPSLDGMRYRWEWQKIAAVKIDV